MALERPGFWMRQPDSETIRRLESHTEDLTGFVGPSIPDRIALFSARKGQWMGDRINICTLEAAESAHLDWHEWQNVTSREIDPIHASWCGRVA